MFAAATLAAFTMTASGVSQAATPAAEALYVVQTSDAPVATYNGGITGIAATRPAAGKKIDLDSANVRSYRSFLSVRRAEVLRQAGVSSGRKVYDYATAFSGFAVSLTAAEAERMRRTPGVAHVWKNTLQMSTTFTTPEFVGLDGQNGAWKRQFGDPTRAGEGVIIGVIDSGFWPENPSFGALPIPRPDQAIIDAKFHGTCDPGTEAPITCNNKVIGARWYNEGGLSTANPGEFDSPRDFYGHGSHTSSTAGGNHDVTASVNGVAVGQISGMAPAARLSIYKVLYSNAAGTQSVGSTADIVAAIDDAVADGVDVINYSIGDNIDSFGPSELAFLNAAIAGVFVAASAGNAGPGASTVDNGMPWETTAAAGTHDRGASKTVTLGNGATYQGVGVGAGVPTTPLVDAAVSGLPGSNPTAAAQCVSGGVLDPAKVAGTIVVCVRGNNARTDKSLAVQQAGGVGMILYNPTPNSLNADYHFVPSIHVDEVAGAAIKAYVATPGATASISASSSAKVTAPDVAAFSSRGPTVSSNGDLLKPDIMAPGVDVVAASGPPNHNGNLWDTSSGTSMASPHIAGIAALLIQKHPNWSPMAVKSALMTTASVLDNEGEPIGDQGTGEAATPLDMGSGEVQAAAAFNPGLVYDSGPTQWLRFACGIGVHLSSGGADVCDTVGTVDPSDFNSPSIAVGDLAGSQTLRRTVTNVTKRAGVYLASVRTPAGFAVTVSPKLLVVPAGASRSFTIKISRTSAELGGYSFGSLTWSDLSGHRVRSPIAVRAVSLSAPAETTVAGTSGSTDVPLRTGYAGTLTAAAYGLAPSTVADRALTPHPQGSAFDPTAPAASEHTGAIEVTVPDGIKLTRFATYNADYPAGTDIDLYVYANNGGELTLVGVSSSGGSDETVTLTAGGEYVAFVDLFASDGPLTVHHHHYVVPPSNAGNITVTPASQAITVGGVTSVTVGWSGLTAGRRYLGLVEYGNGTATVGSTVVAANA